MSTGKSMKQNDYFYYTDEIPDKDLPSNALIPSNDDELTSDDMPIKSVRND